MKVNLPSGYWSRVQPLSNKIRWLSCLGLTLWLGMAPTRTANGQMYVEDWGYRMIREYTTAGAVIRSPLVTFPSGPAGPVGLSLDGAGNIFAGDGNAGVVREYTTAGATVNNLFITGVGHPYEVLCDGNGRLYVADAQNCRVGVYDTTTG